MKDLKTKLVIKAGGLKKLPAELTRLGYSPEQNKLFLITDARLHKVSKKILMNLKKDKWHIHEIQIFSGEGHKNLKQIEKISKKMLDLGANRGSVILALGGGSVGDVAGFVASIYMRGISWIGLPSTLLAQVDSCLGGKTGVNLFSHKNMLGSFYPAELVICDTTLLKTLPKRELVSGLGEILKYGVSLDAKFFKWINKNMANILKADSMSLEFAVKRSLKLKMKVVKKDPFETKGIREVLNFGHTFGHALEAATNFKRFRHGEAVIWGMRFALELSQIKKVLHHKDYEFLKAGLMPIDLPSLPSNLSFDLLFKYMLQDKKVKGKGVRFILLTRAAKSVIDNKISTDELKSAYSALRIKA